MICLDYPRSREILQCKNGHLLCNSCYLRIQEADPSLCPVCRVKLSRDNPCRSILAESIVSKLIVHCSNSKCAEQMQNAELRKHEHELCLYRQTRCKFAVAGCEWKGVARLKRKHEKSCAVAAFDAHTMVKSVMETARRKELGEVAKKQKSDACARLVAMLSKRHRDVAVRQVEFGRIAKYSNLEKVIGCTRFTMFGNPFIFEIVLKKNEKGKDEDKLKKKEGDSEMKKASNESQVEYNSAFLRIKCGKKMDRKIRVEGFLLGGPEYLTEMSPVYFKMIVRPKTTDSKNFELVLTPSMLREINEITDIKMRLIMFNKESGYAPCFLIKGDRSYELSDRELDDMEDMYEDYSEDLEYDEYGYM